MVATEDAPSGARGMIAVARRGAQRPQRIVDRGCGGGCHEGHVAVDAQRLGRGAAELHGRAAARGPAGRLAWRCCCPTPFPAARARRTCGPSSRRRPRASTRFPSWATTALIITILTAATTTRHCCSNSRMRGPPRPRCWRQLRRCSRAASGRRSTRPARRHDQCAYPFPLACFPRPALLSFLHVTTFLSWAAEPHLEERHKIGFRAIVYLIIITILVYFSMKKIWSRIETKV